MIDILLFYYRVISTVSTNAFLWWFMRNDYGAFIRKTTMTLVKTDVLFVKIIQALSNSHELLDKEMDNELMRYTDRVPYNEEDCDRDIIKYIETKTPFTFVHDTPFRSGMISLIYMLKHKETGEKYILKIKRKLIKEKLDKSIYRMRSLLSIISTIVFWWSRVELSETIVKHFSVLKHQLDFSKEKENMNIFYNNFQHIDYVKIPKLIDETSRLNDNYIIMEYIDGKSFSEVSKDNYNNYAKMITKMGLTCMMVNGTAHGDLHAGNIIFIENDETICKQQRIPKFQVGIIDFGLVVTIPKKIQDELHFGAANYRRQGKMHIIAERYISAVIYPSSFLETLGKDIKEKIINEIAELMSTMMFEQGNTACQERLYHSFQLVNKYIQDVIAPNYKIKLDNDFASMQVALSMTNGVSLQLCENNFNRLLSEAIDEMFHTDLFGSDSEDETD
jgi:predicted unusual protein kinase regulating ubiquinone biosynthesis (AarF/ABC1/UbiB family)